MAKRRQMGRPDYEPIIIPGSIATPEDARQRADDAFEGIIKWLTEGPPKVGKDAKAEEAPVQATRAAGASS